MRNDPRYQIGPICWKLRPAGPEPIRYSTAPYDVFFNGDGERAICPLSTLSLTVHEGMCDLPDSPPLFQAGKNWAVWDEGNTLFFGVGLDSRPFRRACRVFRDLDKGELWAGDEALESPLRYPLDQVLGWGMLSQCGGFLLHAAAAVRDGVGWLFAGRSGAGKSTLSELARAAGWDILNDDRVILYPANGGWWMAGTPWHGSGRFWKNRQVPLGGVFLLQQDNVNVVEPLVVSEARLALLEVISVPWFEPAWSQATLDALAHMSERVAVSRFRFTKEPSAVRCMDAVCAAPGNAVAMG